MNWDREELAWAAGFYDGEGYSRANARKSKSGLFINWTPQVAVVQKRTEPLARLTRLFGFGSVTTRKTQSGCHEWRIHNFEHAQAFMAAVWFKLSPHKKEQFIRTFHQMRIYHAELLPDKKPRGVHWRKRSATT